MPGTVHTLKAPVTSHVSSGVSQELEMLRDSYQKLYQRPIGEPSAVAFPGWVDPFQKILKDGLGPHLSSILTVHIRQRRYGDMCVLTFKMGWVSYTAYITFIWKRVLYTCIRLFPQSATMIFPLLSTATPVGALNCPFPSPFDPNFSMNSPSWLNTCIKYFSNKKTQVNLIVPAWLTLITWKRTIIILRQQKRFQRECRL